MESQNPSESGAQTPEKIKPNPDIKEGPSQAAPDLLFFNVMPKNQNSGQMVEPSIKSENTEAPAQEKTGFAEIFNQYKLYFIGGGIIIILLPALYFGFNYFGSPDLQEDLLIPKNLPKPTPVQVGEGITTPQEWRDKYFPNCLSVATCGDTADADKDGLNNLKEFELKTDPNNEDSDQDGIADGDEVNVFASDPLASRTANNDKFNDLDYVKGGFSFTDDKKLTDEQIKTITAKMAEFGLHQPTITSIDTLLTSLYKFSPADGSVPTSTPETVSTPTSTPATATSSPLSGLDMSLAAKQDRDTKRSNTIKNIEIALVKYRADNTLYPKGPNFSAMFSDIKPYLKVATNSKDPIDIEPYVYTYSANSDQTDFTLTFYSEVAMGPISKHAVDAEKDANMQNAETYDNQRKVDLEELRTALLLYSNTNADGNQTYVFPTIDKYKTALVPDFILAIPTDPMTKKDYVYQPSDNFDAFTLKATLQNPPSGNTGYLCNQIDECDYY